MERGSPGVVERFRTVNGVSRAVLEITGGGDTASCLGDYEGLGTLIHWCGSRIGPPIERSHRAIVHDLRPFRDESETFVLVFKKSFSDAFSLRFPLFGFALIFLSLVLFQPLLLSLVFS